MMSHVFFIAYYKVCGRKRNPDCICLRDPIIFSCCLRQRHEFIKFNFHNFRIFYLVFRALSSDLLCCRQFVSSLKNICTWLLVLQVMRQWHYLFFRKGNKNHKKCSSLHMAIHINLIS